MLFYHDFYQGWRFIAFGQPWVLILATTDTNTLAQRIADLGEPLYGKLEPTGYPALEIRIALQPAIQCLF